MVHISSLPTEILSCIFDHVDPVAQVAAYRLVCRGWNHPVEKAMSSKKIKISDERQAFQLYNHLCKNPANGHLIKHMDFDMIETTLPLIYEYLMDIAFTPTMERLTGYIGASTFFGILTSIARKKSWEFPNLKKLPFTLDGSDFIQADTMKQLQTSSLYVLFANQDANKAYPKVIKLIDGFKNLTFLELDDFVDNWVNLDHILKRCSSLETLTLSCIHCINGTATNEQIHALMIQHDVNKELSLKAIELKDSIYDSALIEYLVYKYPNVSRFKAGGDFADHYYNDLHHILDSLERIPSKELTMHIYPEDNIPLQKAIKMTDSCTQKVIFETTEYNGVLMRIEF